MVDPQPGQRGFLSYKAVYQDGRLVHVWVNKSLPKRLQTSLKHVLKLPVPGSVTY